MVQISDLYVAFMLSGFPACFAGESFGDEIENGDKEDGTEPLSRRQADTQVAYREVV